MWVFKRAGIHALAGINDKTGITVFCSKARHFTLTVPLSTQVGEFNPGG